MITEAFEWVKLKLYFFFVSFQSGVLIFIFDFATLISMGLCPVGVDRGVHKFPPLVSVHGNGLGLPHTLLAPFFDVI